VKEEVNALVRSYRLRHTAIGVTEVNVDFAITRIDNEDFERALKEFVGMLASGHVKVSESDS
jgi:hypothetical protein